MIETSRMVSQRPERANALTLSYSHSCKGPPTSAWVEGGVWLPYVEFQVLCASTLSAIV